MGRVSDLYLDHLIAIPNSYQLTTSPITMNERHLRGILRSYLSYYRRWRVHWSLEMDAPEPRPVQPPELGPVRKLPEVGGLHHHYERMTV